MTMIIMKWSWSKANNIFAARKREVTNKILNKWSGTIRWIRIRRKGHTFCMDHRKKNRNAKKICSKSISEWNIRRQQMNHSKWCFRHSAFRWNVNAVKCFRCANILILIVHRRSHHGQVSEKLLFYWLVQIMCRYFVTNGKQMLWIHTVPASQDMSCCGWGFGWSIHSVCAPK